MFKNNIVTYSQLITLGENLRLLNMQQACNVNLVKQIRLALPTCQPFDMELCVTNNAEYRLWCAIRSDVISLCKELENG